MPIIGVTERSRFKRCRRAWDYSDRQHLQCPVDKIDARWIGRGIHAALAGYYEGRDIIDSFHNWLDQKLPQPDRDALPVEDFRKLEDIIILVEGVLRGYAEYAEANDFFEVLAVEKELYGRISGTWGKLRGTVDLVVRIKSRLWVVDHKSVAGFVDPEMLDFDDQMTAYLWLVWKTFDEFPAGAIYNQLRKKLPAEPYLLKSGKALSRDKSIDTTRAKYLEAIHRHGFDPADYVDVLEKIGTKEFFKRELVPRNKNELISFETRLKSEYRDMNYRRTPLYINPTRDCGWCDYRLLCKAENEGGDVDSLKSALFVVDPERRL